MIDRFDMVEGTRKRIISELTESGNLKDIVYLIVFLSTVVRLRWCSPFFYGVHSLVQKLPY
jgi:hypothetical protein